MADRRAGLADAVAAHVRPGDTLYLSVGHHRWSAANYEIVRRFWQRDPGFTLVMLSLSSLGALFFRGGLVRKVITGYSGDTFPNFTPNPHFGRAYTSGDVEVEHWGFLALTQRLEAAARGLPAITTRSVVDTSMEDNDAFASVPSPFGDVGLLAPLVPDVAVLHAPIADVSGNVAVEAPLLEGVWGALAARRGAIVTVERIVDDIREWSHLVRIPAHRVAAVVEAPFGAHPGGIFTRDLPADGYGEDHPFWFAARDATRADDYDGWIREWVLDVDHDGYLARLGEERLDGLRALGTPDPDADPDVVVGDGPPSAWECAAVYAARHVRDRVLALEVDAVLAGAGVANLAAWRGVALAREAGSEVQLTAEIGMWGYEPAPGDPFVLSHANFWRSTMLTDASMVLGGFVADPRTTALACLGAAQIDRFGNLNSTLTAEGHFLVGSGGGNDVASVADEAVVVATLRPQRTPEELGYITSPGRAVRALVTDLGILERAPDGELTLTAVPMQEGGRTDIDAAVAAAREACGWELAVAADIGVLDPPSADEVAALRRHDPNGYLLRG